MSLFNDPVKWSAQAVGTWPRLFLLWALLLVVIGATVYVAADSGLRSGLAAASFLAVYQLILLYALRELLIRVQGHALHAASGMVVGLSARSSGDDQANVSR